jgi:hypothetical protein
MLQYLIFLDGANILWLSKILYQWFVRLLQPFTPLLQIMEHCCAGFKPSIIAKIGSGWWDHAKGHQHSLLVISIHSRWKLYFIPNSFGFPTRLLLGLYNYRFKHFTVMEKQNHDVVTMLHVDGLLFFRSEESESRMTPGYPSWSCSILWRAFTIYHMWS